MKVLFLICALAAHILITHSSVIQPNLDVYSIPANYTKEQMTDDLVNFLRPYQTHLQQWFWALSGVSYGSPHFSELTEIGTMADYITCEICTPALPLVKLLVNNGVGKEVIILVLSGACQILNLAPKPEICEPTIRSYATPILYIVENKPDTPVEDFCGIINRDCGIISPHLNDWTIDIPPPAKSAPPKKTLPSGGLPLQNPTTKILQFTDLHLDLDYVQGKKADCGLPVCCRETDGDGTSPAWTAGKYGHFSCATPPDALDALYKHAAETHSEAKLIFLTGDYIHSGIWLYGVDENTRHHVAITTKLKAAFASTNAEIYPLVGNHEPDVVNMYPPESVWSDFPIEWMYKSVADAFGPFLPPDQMTLFLKYGYYTVTSKVDPNMRIIALNTNLCYINNFWLPYDAVDTSGQLKWFVEQLQAAESAGQSVLLLGHIFPGSGSCWSVWSNQFERIIKRYHGTIRAQWYGHSHEQDYHLAFDGETPINVGFIGGSGVTDGMNSGYNVFYADGERGADSTWEILNHETYILNLTHSNAQPDSAEPTFNKILNAQEMWGVSSMNAKEVHDFIYRMVCDDNLFLEYQKVVTKGADSARFNPCVKNDYRCKANVLGSLFVLNSGDSTHRDRLSNHILTVDCKLETNTPAGASEIYGVGLFLTILANAVVLIF